MIWAFQVALVVKNLPANAGDIRNMKFDPWVRKIPWRSARQPTLHYSCLDRGAWCATVHKVAQSWT